MRARHRPDGLENVMKGHSMLPLALTLAIGLGLIGVAIVAAVAWVLLPDAREGVRTDATRAGRRRTLLDPNEAARAAGSWG